MDSYGEICYEVGLDLEPNKYAKLRKAAMLAQEEQNDPLPCALLCLDELFLRIRGMFKPQKKDPMLDGRPPKKRIHQARDMKIPMQLPLPLTTILHNQTEQLEQLPLPLPARHQTRPVPTYP